MHGVQGPGDTREVRHAPAPPAPIQGPVPQSLGLATLLLVYAVHLALSQGGWLLSGAIWAEAATNYYPHAIAPSWAERLFATDAGYVPLPQRLLSLAGAALPVAMLPWFQSLCAGVLAIACTGVLVLPCMRALVPTDAMRWIGAAVLLLAADFQTSTFINVAYFAAVPIAAATALALAEPGQAPPRWAWLLPLLCLSKPAVLVLMPATLLAALRTGWRFRVIAALMLSAALAQGLQLVASHAAGTMASAQAFTLVERVTGTMRLGLAYLAAFVAPPLALLPPTARMVGGLLLAGATALTYCRASRGGRAMIGCGALMLAGNFALLAFTLGDFWLDPARLGEFRPMRQDHVALAGAVFIVLGGVGALPVAPRLRGGLFYGWTLTLLASAWASPDARPPGLRASQWQVLARELASGRTPLCVPVDPAGWVLGRDCRSLGAGFRPGLALALADAPVRDIQVTRPALDGAQVLAIGVMARPEGEAPVAAAAQAVLDSGARIALAPVATLPAAGGMVLFRAPKPIAAGTISGVSVQFAAPVRPANYRVFAPGVPVSAWLGN